MPVNIGNNLTLKNTDLSGTYGELFNKLNVAYGWTHTKTTSSGGTAVLISNGDIINTYECNDINNCYGQISNEYPQSIQYIIADGKIYDSSGSQVGTKNNWKMIYSNSGGLGIDSNGDLYSNYTNPTKLSGSNYTYISGYYAIASGCLYYVNYGTVTQIGTENTWTDILYGSSAYGISNGYLYRISGTNVTLVGENNNWVKLYPGQGPSTAYCKNSDDELYNIGSLSVLYASNVKKMCPTQIWDGYVIYITNNGELYNQKKKINSDITNWTDISGMGSYENTKNIYAIGDGKLYNIVLNDNSYTITQIGTDTNFQKIEGGKYASVAWTGDATTVSHTVYTTKSPQANDDTYIDEDLTKYSTVQASTGTTITDQYRTYTRDASKDTTFTAIPPATIHETVSTVDFLRITNPNT